MRAALIISIVFLAGFGIVSAACSGGDDKPEATSPAATQPPASPAAAATVPAGAAATAVPTAAPTAAGGDPCSLITKQEASTALGQAAKDPVSTSLGSTPVGPGLTVVVAHCEFLSTDEESYVQIDLWRTTGATAAIVRQVVEQVICMGRERVTGIGEVACWFDSDRAELQVVKGATFIAIRVSPDVNNPGDAVRTLAMRAVGRIP